MICAPDGGFSGGGDGQYVQISLMPALQALQFRKTRKIN